MIHTVRLHHHAITLGDLIEFVASAQRIGVSPERRVTIRVAPTSNHPTDPGGEITVEVSVDQESDDLAPSENPCAEQAFVKCDRPGCPVLHSFPPIHPEDADAFHERTGRCLTDHNECALLEVNHRRGKHDECLIAECREPMSGITEADVERTMAMHEGKSGWDGQSLLRERNHHADCADSSLCASRECEVYQRIAREDPTKPGTMDHLMAGLGRTPAEEAFYAPPPPLTLEQRVERLEAAVAALNQRPSPYDVIGDQMNPGR